MPTDTDDEVRRLHAYASTDESWTLQAVLRAIRNARTGGWLDEFEGRYLGSLG